MCGYLRYCLLWSGNDAKKINVKRINEEIIQFFRTQGALVVSTIDPNGAPHASCKGMVNISKTGRVHLLDLYTLRTYANLKRNPHISITAVDEHKFIGYSLKGKAKIVPADKLSPKLLKAWEGRITSRVTQRLIKNIRGEKGHPRHPEVLLPKPQYLIEVEVEEVVDLTPHHINRGND